MSATERKPPSDSHFIDDLRVLDVSSTIAGGSKRHIEWSGSVGPLLSMFPDAEHVAIMTLHEGSKSGWVTVTVGGILTLAEGRPREMSGDPIAVGESSALESLYDFARLAARTAAGLVGYKANLPLRSPDPTVEVFQDLDGDNSVEPKTPTPGE